MQCAPSVPIQHKPLLAHAHVNGSVLLGSARVSQAVSFRLRGDIFDDGCAASPPEERCARLAAAWIARSVVSLHFRKCDQ